MSNTKNLANLAAALDDGTSGQVLTSQGSGAVAFADSTGSGVTVYTGLSGTDGTPTDATYLLNASSPSAGDLAYVTANTSLYQNNGNGWYRIAVINTTPTISSVADASSNTTPFTLEGGTNTVITVTASDADEGTDLAYSYSVTSGSLNGTTVTQGTGASENVFTITPHASNATTFSLTFTVSDNINAATSVAAFTLEFSIADSKYTTLLMATDGSAGDNNDISDSSSSNQTITVNGDAHAGTFSPYRHGGYSTYFDGNDYLSIAHSTDLDLGTGNFTIEGWWRFDDTSNQNLVSKYAANAGFVVQYQSGNLRLVLGLGGSDAVYSFSWTPVAGTWYHVCILRDGTNGKAFINGTQIGSTTTVTTSNVGTTGTLQIGLTHTVSEYTRGYVSDVRIVKGTAITPASGGPTERLTAVTNTKLLTCHLPYISDGSSSAHSITVNGNTSTEPIGPYDYSDEYSKSINGGSVYFDGDEYIDIAGGASLTLDGSDFTIEGWFYRTSTASKQTLVNFALPHNTIIISLNRTGVGDTYVYLGNGSGWSNGATPSINSGSNYPIPINTWNHVALVNNSGTITLYHNGYSVGTTTTLPTGMTGNLRLGAYRTASASGEYFSGYISGFRVVKGTAVYTGNFTPPSGPLTTTGGTYPSTTNVNTSITASNTKLLLSGTDAHVIDKSQSANLKLVGNAAASTTQAKFSNTASVYFDGNGDYIDLGSAIVPTAYDTDYTIEMWIYPTTTGSRKIYLINIRQLPVAEWL